MNELFIIFFNILSHYMYFFNLSEILQNQVFLEIQIICFRDNL